MTKTTVLLAGASAFAVLFAAAPGWAQTQAPVSTRDGAPVQDDEASEVEEVVVTGTRAAGRSRLETISPVDVISDEALAQQGTTELAQGLSNLAPSISFSRPSITDGTDTVRPATLRGLAPDQTLVLLNGTRRHTSALVNANGSIGRGSAAVDLNAIPGSAVERVEILREGASAQYGSDAIAGVINLRLREAREGGSVTATIGQNFTEFTTARAGQRSEEDGRTITVSGWQGLPLGADGFLTISAEYRDRQPTSRGDLDPRLSPRPARITSRFGDPEVKDATIYANAGLPLGNGFELYGFGGYQHREAESAATPRTFNNPNNDPAVYPEGFLPIIAPTVDDYTLAGGVRGTVAGFSTTDLVYAERDRLPRRELINGSLVPQFADQLRRRRPSYDQFVLGQDRSRPYTIVR
jgi:iron complex outermembrane receptor protein